MSESIETHTKELITILARDSAGYSTAMSESEAREFLTKACRAFAKEKCLKVLQDAYVWTGVNPKGQAQEELLYEVDSRIGKSIYELKQ